MSDDGIEAVLDNGAIAGKSPTRSDTNAALYRIDVQKPALYRLHPVRGERTSGHFYRT